uniref:Placenta associated 8, tandem duplicate 1 n=1 Tax=Sinocyclocheilus anshuiensis TaxID=1608454 RepID=A0A671P2Z5_9TELE
MEVTSQPAAFEPRDFHTGLMSCCDDMGVCCCGFFCLPCLGCSIASEMNECCLCGLGMPIRSVYRTKYNIPVSIYLYIYLSIYNIGPIYLQFCVICVCRDLCVMTGWSHTAAYVVQPAK